MPDNINMNNDTIKLKLAELDQSELELIVEMAICYAASGDFIDADPDDSDEDWYSDSMTLLIKYRNEILAISNSIHSRLLDSIR